jgi:hypothetical protein
MYGRDPEFIEGVIADLTADGLLIQTRKILSLPEK